MPGTTLVCGDSHTAAHGALGALAFGIGTSEVEHVLATQTLLLRPSKTMEVRVDGELGFGVSPKDLILAIIGRIGAAGGTGHVIEYRGEAFARDERRGPADRLPTCRSRRGARAGLIAPDETTFAYLKGRPMAPQGEEWDAAVAWLARARHRRGRGVRQVGRASTQPTSRRRVTWGTSPEDVVPITGAVPDPGSFADPSKRRRGARSRSTIWASTPGQRCRTSRSSMSSSAAAPTAGSRICAPPPRCCAARKVAAASSRRLVVPGSGLVKRQAEAEGLDRVFIEAGFEWREPGCSMCLAMNPDKVPPRRALRLDLQPQFRRPAGPGRAHAPGLAGDGRGGGGDRAARRRQGAGRRHEEASPTSIGRAIPFGRRNVDTDIIIAAQLSEDDAPRRARQGRFEAVRAEPGNVFDDPAFAGARILIAGDNFGCGSSREHAAWALADMGIEAVIAPSFSDIFSGNAFRTASRPSCCRQPAVERLLDVAREHVISVDLEAMTVSSLSGDRFGFEMDEFQRECLMAGLDEIALSLSYEAAIRAYEVRTGT